MILNPFVFLIGRVVAQRQGVSDAEATRLGLVGSVLPVRPRALGIVLVSAIARGEAGTVPTVIPSPTPPKLIATLSSESQINLSWSRSSIAVTYNVNRGTASGKETPIALGLAETTYFDTGLDTTKSIFYTVDACDASSKVIASSNEVKVDNK